MDYLWSPWRYQYLTAPRASTGCVFCSIISSDRDEENLIVHRAAHNFVVLNKFPYTSGHLMVVPYAHAAELSAITDEASAEMMALAKQSEAHLRSVYRPDGLNIGMNIGASAGAGVAGHIHAHVLPRWPGDVNFMTTVAETRVIPESLEATYDKLVAEFQHG